MHMAIQCSGLAQSHCFPSWPFRATLSHISTVFTCSSFGEELVILLQYTKYAATSSNITYNTNTYNIRFISVDRPWVCHYIQHDWLVKLSNSTSNGEGGRYTQEVSLIIKWFQLQDYINGSCATWEAVNATFEQVHELQGLSVNQKLYWTWFSNPSLYTTFLCDLTNWLTGCAV